jgi:muramidase (phage lysozyme)
MARQPYRPMEAEPLRPVASPVDTFVRPQEPSRDSNLQDLARSLSGLGGSLAGMVGKRDAQAEEDDKIRGEAAFWETRGTGAAEAVSRGLIPAQATPAPKPPAPAEPVRVKSTYDGAAAWYKVQPPETKALMDQMAAREGVTVRAMSQKLHQRALDTGAATSNEDPRPVPARAAPGKQSSMMAPDGTPIETASAQQGDRIGRAFQEAIDAPPAPDTVRLIGEVFERAIASKTKPQGGYASASLRDDPKAARILDFVAGPESGGNYNAFYGNGWSTKDLSAMTLDQVMAWSGNRGTESSATGRYQFMKKTLVGLKQEMGLSGSEKFSPELQDRMALQLLNRRGYSEWQAGRITDAQFANRLALEWASLPNITAQNGRPAGVSAYAGDGLNKSLVTPASVLAALTGQGGSEGGALSRLFGRRKQPVNVKPTDDEGTRI